MRLGEETGGGHEQAPRVSDQIITEHLFDVCK